MSTTLALCLSLAACHAAAADAPSSTTPSTEHQLDAIEIEAIAPPPPRRTRASITRIDSNAPRKRMARVVADLLHGETGSYVQRTTPGQGALIVRGMKGSEVLHRVDGFRLNNALFRNAPTQYTALVDAQLIDQVDVLRGASATRYGSDAMGGVVDLYSHEPQFDGTDWQQRLRVSTAYQSADQAQSSRIAWAAGDQRWVLSGGASYQEADQRRVGGGTRLPFTAYSEQAADAKLRWQVSDSSELMLQRQSLEQPRTPRHDELVAGFGQSRPSAELFWFAPQRRNFTQLRWRWAPDLIWFDQLQLQVGRQHIQDGRQIRELGARVEDQELSQSDLRGLSLQFDKQAGAHALSFGFEFWDDAIDSQRQRRDLDSGSLSPRRPRFPDDSRMRQGSLYLLDDYALDDDTTLSGGLRWNRAEVHIPADNNGLGVDLQPQELSGQLGLSRQINATLSVFAGYGRGFRAPNVFDLGSFGERPGNRFELPNPDLRSETVDSYELGLRYVDRSLELEWVSFVADHKDRIGSVLTGERTASGRLISQNRNLQSARLQGWEARLQWHASDRIDAYLSASATRGEETSQDVSSPADRIPPLFGSAGLAWQVDPRLRIDAYSLFAGRQDRLSPRDSVDPRINPLGTAGWSTWNVSVDYQLSTQLRVQVRGDNLGDRRYREHGSGLDSPGRGLMLALDWRPGD